MYRIIKFGGSSVASPERVLHIIRLLQDQFRPYDDLVVVFSAFGGITDLLIDMCSRASAGDTSYVSLYDSYVDRHKKMINHLFNDEVPRELESNLLENHGTLENLLRGVFLVGEISHRTLDHVLSFGERNGNVIIAEAMNLHGIPSVYVDARKIIRTNSDFGNAKVDFPVTETEIINYFKTLTGKVPIVTGFIGSDKKGITTTLGRGGSDYTAAILSGALDAAMLEIWTDVDGVLTADPRKVLKAFTVPELSYTEAMEMSHFGAKVIYPPTILPAFKKSIPIYIKNTFNPTFSGTLIKNTVEHSGLSPIKGISSLSEICLITLQGSGLMGKIGVASRFLSVLGREKINIILITQASSEYSISVAIEEKWKDKALQAIRHEFEKEIGEGALQPMVEESSLCVVAVIGERMRHVPGISGKLFNSLGKNGINVMAIAQGSSELNISFVIKKSDEIKTLNAIHDSFFLSDVKRVHVFVVGTGLIGNALLNQIDEQKSFLREELHLDIIVNGLANSKKMLLQPDGITLKNWKEELESNGEDSDLEFFIEKMKSFNFPNSIFVDNTASQIVPSFYKSILQNNISISTPNKIAASSSLASYKELRQIAREKMIHLLFETNVGAGLPVLSTMRSLIHSGDKILKIEAVLSGSLSYIFNTFEPGVSFADLVRKARDFGYTEPDPRDDLSGMDVKRKIIILAREGGFDVDEKDVVVEPFISSACMDAPDIPSFFEKLKEEEHLLASRVLEAKARDGFLRFIAVFENNKLSVSLQEVEKSSPFVSLAGSDNMIVFTTQRYHERPLVIKGPGAGAEVTAAGVFSEIISAGQ